MLKDLHQVYGEKPNIKNIKMHIETLYMVCSKSVPWELDNKDKRIIERHKDLPVSEIVKKLWAAASK